MYIMQKSLVNHNSSSRLHSWEVADKCNNSSSSLSGDKTHQEQTRALGTSLSDRWVPLQALEHKLINHLGNQGSVSKPT